MSAADDRRFLEGLAGMAGVDGDEDGARRLLEIAARIENPPVEVVEQRTFGKVAGAPDGWSWQDIGPFHGYFSGIRLQRGEPVVEQDGHLLYIRQGEVSFQERQRPIYELQSRCGIQDERGMFRPNSTVFVVHGFLGDRTGLTRFWRGKMLATEFTDAEGITAAVYAWLRDSHKEPIVRRKRPPRPPHQERLAG